MDKSTLLSYQPEYYKNSKVIDNINNSNAIELTKIQEKITNTLNQFFLTSVDTNMDRWEKEFGITTNTNLSIEERRTNILSKIKGIATSTVPNIKNIVELFDYSECEIVEHNDDYKFDVKFNNYYRVPTDVTITEIRKRLEEFKPAHLNYKVTYKYNWWDMQDDGTWNDGGTWDDLRNYKEEL